MENLLSVAYMPVVESDGGNVLYWEALARIRESGEDETRHRQFIAAGEEFGFIHLIDKAMFRKVAARLRLQPDLVAGVNISILTVERHLGLLLGEFYQHVDVVDRMIFELTETVQITDSDTLKNFIYCVKRANARVALDDVENGHFQIKHIHELEPDFVKVSGRTVDLVLAGKANAQRFNHLRLATDGRGGKLVAENIDTEEKRTAIKNLGVPFVQGYLFGQPIRESARVDELTPLPMALAEACFSQKA
ncbi:EAL domain-containing protein [Candidimonas nitroreducens]|uniref:EAL domain-containing protein n=1 Tax=Candidimonas nitroreducens TaxID=683354 RepID=A0A225ML38_9BURK|nr:EAL domain-containing protein [Candidimonas nitroreducens]OWT62036.1 hypothetical protein CEY11_09535 [Candidimonas nitroreducens]